MSQLQEIMDEEEFACYTEKGDFTIRRSDNFWGGIWSDMIIEQASPDESHESV